MHNIAVMKWQFDLEKRFFIAIGKLDAANDMFGKVLNYGVDKVCTIFVDKLFVHFRREIVKILESKLLFDI